MAVQPDSLRVQTYQIWTPGNPPQPVGERVDVWILDDKGDLHHKWWDGTVNQWQGWENLGQP